MAWAGGSSLGRPGRPESGAGAGAAEGAEGGYSLVELMVVLLVIGVLTAIAIPTFLGVKAGAQDRAQQQNLTNALVSAKTAYSLHGYYGSPSGTTAANTQALISVMSSQEPELSFVTTAPTKGTNQILVGVSQGGQQIVLMAQSSDGTCWGLSDNEEESTSYVLGTVAKLPIGESYAAWKASTCTMLTTAAASQVWARSYPGGPGTNTAP